MNSHDLHMIRSLRGGSSFLTVSIEFDEAIPIHHGSNADEALTHKRTKIRIR